MKANFLQNADKIYVKLTVHTTHVQTCDIEYTRNIKDGKKVLGWIPSGGLIVWGVFPGSPRLLTVAQWPLGPGVISG